MRRALWAALFLLGCGGADDSLAGAPNGDASAPQGSAMCVDLDHDGFGPSCARGPDCDDSTSAITDQCYRCAEPDDGCPCTDEGATIACGKIESRTDDGRVICMKGERLCKAGTWSACAPSDVLDTRPSLKALGGPVGCTNPCDPYCKSFPDVPDPSLSNDAGVVGSEAGIAVIPTVIDAGPPAACASTTAEAKPIPLDIAVMFDKSGSMAGSRWTSATTALSTYAASPSAKGVTMGLGFFPQTKTVPDRCCFLWWCWDCSTTTETCASSDYAAFSVPMGVLPGSATGHALNIQAALAGESPGGGTPTRPALEGAISFARTWQTANPTHKTLVVLATDGEPNDCSSTVAATAAVATAGFTGSPQIPTYVIGVGPSLTNLDVIAKAGSGNAESYIPVASGDTTAFIDAMKRIQSKGASCDYILPSPASGDVEPNATDVQLKNTATGMSSALARFADKTACGTGQGFYFDSPTSPKRLTLCPTTCAAINGSATQKVEVVFKCKATCGKGAFKAEPVPIAMHIMLDRSGSMAGSRWTNVTSALKTFINDPSSDGMAVGIDYFGQGSDICQQSNYNVPSVGISLLPGNRSTLVSSINGTSTGGGTPTEPALRGAITYARSYAVANPTYTPVVVLATDGEPTGCNGTTNQPVPIGDNVSKTLGVLGTPSIRTYVIGVGSGVSATNMDYIANRGGTSKAYMVNDGSPTAFLTAMQDIRRQNLSCEFKIPATSLGVMDIATVQVRYPRDDGSIGKPARGASAAACGAAGGYYFDNSATPTKIFLCPATCADMNAQDATELYVLYDCLNGGDGTFTRDYRIDCPVGSRPVWGLWSWNADTPGDAEIDFYVSSGNTLAEVAATAPAPMRFTNPPGPSTLVGQPIGARDTPINTQVGAAYVDTSLALAGMKRNTTFLRVQARMKGTLSTPLLKKWNQEVSCVPNE